jgi:hypothetical protein
MEEDKLASIVIVVVIAVPPAHDRHVETPCHDIQDVSSHIMRHHIHSVVGSAVEETTCHELALIAQDAKDKCPFLFAVGCLLGFVELCP